MRGRESMPQEHLALSLLRNHMLKLLKQVRANYEIAEGEARMCFFDDIVNLRSLLG